MSKSRKITIADGTQVWLLDKQHHRLDGPAVIHPDGSAEWWINGKRHRVDGPAIVKSNGIQVWYFNGWCHREDGPAYIDPNRFQIWYLGGKEIHFGKRSSKKFERKFKELVKLYHVQQILEK